MAAPPVTREQRVQSLIDVVLEGEGAADQAVRLAAFQGSGLPVPLSSVVNTVHDGAYRMTDQDLDGLRSSGYTDDQIFEILVAAALGAGWVRLQQALTAMAGP